MLTLQGRHPIACPRARRLQPAGLGCGRWFFLMGILLLAGQVVAAEESLEAGPDSRWSSARWKFSTGFDYSKGDYGLDEDTELFYVPLAVEVDLFPVRAKITLPLLSIDGPSGILIDGDRMSAERTTGLGQIMGSLGYLWVPPSTAFPYLELIGKLTAPTETSRDLGNGEWAFALQVDAFKDFGRLTAFGHGGRKFYSGGAASDRLYTSVGASLRVHDRVQIGVAYDWFEASVDSVQDTHQISPFAGIKIGHQFSFGPYGLIGLSEGAPDFGIGISVSWRR